MSVEIWFRDGLNTEIVNGDLLTLVNSLNVAAASGKQYALLQDRNGSNLMVETNNIIKAREYDEETERAYIGS